MWKNSLEACDFDQFAQIQGNFAYRKILEIEILIKTLPIMWFNLNILVLVTQFRIAKTVQQNSSIRYNNKNKRNILPVFMFVRHRL